MGCYILEGEKHIGEKKKTKEELGNAEIVISNIWSGKLWGEGNNWAGALRGDS